MRDDNRDPHQTAAAGEAREAPGPDMPQLFLTASEAFPALERAFLSAEDRIVAGFRIFDPATKLRSDEGLAIGETWFDLLVHTFSRGISFDLILSDFDPIVSWDTHQGTWASLRQIWAAAELAGPEARVTVRPGLHPAKIGLLPRVCLWPKVSGELREIAQALNALELPHRSSAMRHLPGLADFLQRGEVPPGDVALRRSGPPLLYPASHHQKLAVIDGETLYIGGLDLNERRYDTLEHDRPAELTWHDVQIMTRGPVAKAAEDYLRAVPEIVRGAQAPPPEQHGLVTTLSSQRRWSGPYLSPQKVRRSILKTILDEVAASHKLIYFETQFFRDRGLARALAAAARRDPELTLAMILPAAPEVIAFQKRKKLDTRFGEFLQARCVSTVRKAFGKRVFFGSPAQPRGPVLQDGPEHRDRHFGAPIVYVHAKLCIFDQRAAIVSSANLNGRSLRWDTEAGMHVQTPGFAAHALSRAMHHWLPEDSARMASDPNRTVRVLRAQAARNARRDPSEREGFILPYNVRVARDFGHDLPIIPDEMV
ncbi:phospholipase D-like domain-containing protein [Profundibacterium mesophilum]|uniref:Phospholipase D n=1 Tax=Profundibacterium mesophilum KAUST100406-0324 TaxID=1037889 RepID=A0A921NXM5_9RHOB|nr:phospholipase D-like domain-containing protein [Profundibacterium mesophilum]KAF0677275.1 phospholipase D [Profundibacterium mesophilum KAUST100406-0324]